MVYAIWKILKRNSAIATNIKFEYPSDTIN